MAKKTPSKRVRIANPPGTSSILKPTRLKLRPNTTSAIRPASRSIARVGVTGRAVLPAIDQTFSTSGLPSSPVGRKISTRTRIEKAATSLYSTVK